MSTHLHIELTLTLDQAIQLQNLLHLVVQTLAHEIQQTILDDLDRHENQSHTET